jgi:CubicO group peptidase (beta-lactamase class C family)
MSVPTTLMYSSLVTLLSSAHMEGTSAQDGSPAGSAAIAGTATPGSATRPDLAAAAALAGRYVADGVMPSVAFGVADEWGVVGVHAVGGTPPVRVDSIYFLASLTKAIVATAVMQYVDEGRWDLRAPLSRYLPGFEGSGREGITAWHILTHTSGLADTPHEDLRRRRPTYGRLLAESRALIPRWTPGSRYEYNSTAWVLLAETMATLSGMPFERALRLRLTGPLGMVDTTFDPRYARRRVQPVSGVDMRNRVVAEVLLRFLARARFAGGGLFGTLPDLLRLGRALLPSASGRDPIANGLHGDVGDVAPPAVLSEAAILAMATPQTEDIPHIAEDGTERPVGQAIGWRTPGPGWPQRPGVITHGGISGSRLWVDRQAGIAFVLLTNLWGASDEPTMAILEAVYAARG